MIKTNTTMTDTIKTRPRSTSASKMTKNNLLEIIQKYEGNWFRGRTLHLHTEI